MALPPRDLGQSIKPRAARCQVQMVVPVDQPAAAWQAAECRFERRIVARIADQPDRRQGDLALLHRSAIAAHHG